MQIEQIPFVRTGLIHPLSQDYLLNKPELLNYYRFIPDLSGMEETLAARPGFKINRALLVERLKAQFQEFAREADSQKVMQNIDSLADENTFTITTGHQLNIFTGPLFFVYKIASAISYAAQLSEKFPAMRFVPVYWMASEDHDFDEVNHFYIFGKKLCWEAPANGAVGRLMTDSLISVLDELETLLGQRDHSQELMGLFRQAYRPGNTMAEATRFLVHTLFKEYGLIVIDADDAELKREFTDVFKEDIFKNSFNEFVGQARTLLSENYNPPVNPRPINVFYLMEGSRLRITKEGEAFKADNLKQWTTKELATELEAHPDRFSPNVVLRPMYQERILPNLAYIGGNSEIAYWLELQTAFTHAGIFYPQLIVRDSALFIGRKFAKELESFKLKPEDMLGSFAEVKFRFYTANELHHPALQVLDSLIETHQALRESTTGLAKDIAATIARSGNEQVAELKKLKKDLNKRLEEEQEKNITKLEKIYNAIYPDGDFQERHDNFIPYYIQYGADFIPMLIKAFNPLEQSLKVFLDKE